TNPGDEITYSFTGAAGQTLYLNGLISAQGTVVYLYGPAGNEVFGQYIANNYYIYNDYGPFTLSASGTFTLVVSNEYGDTGSFDFILLDTSTAASIPLATGPGASVSDQIAVGLSAKIYTLSGTAGEQVYFQAQTESAGFYDLHWELYGPNDEAIS